MSGVNGDGFIAKSRFHYELPPRLIAQEPLKRRDMSRMLVLNRETAQISHEKFSDLHKYLKSGDCLVLNDTRVIPARLTGKKATGAVVELLLVKRLPSGEWEALARPAKRLKTGDCVTFGENIMTAEITGEGCEGIRRVRLTHDGGFYETLDKLGETPLPPYITKRLVDKSAYQTVYADKAGSCAAPTAGLHFTSQTLERLCEKGIKTAKITLHVGLGTFRPVKTDNLLDHVMHSESFSVDRQNAAVINEARNSGGRIVCVGTTSVRALETVARLNNGEIASACGETDIFLYPGCDFKITDALLTNFHLPESTLMALVCAFAGEESIMRAYREAVSLEYRFFSFGDAMLII